MPRHRGAGRVTRAADRPRDLRPARERILIVCEGEKTERLYFEGLIAEHRLSRVEVQVRGAGRVTLSLVEHAESLQERTNPFAEIWCVFGLDDCPPDQFDNAVRRTTNHPFLRAAWSNACFEL